MDVTMTQLQEPFRAPEPETEPGPGPGPEPEPVYEHWRQEPGPDYPTYHSFERKDELEVDKKTIILIIAAFVVGLLLGSMRRPIILKA